MRCLRKPVGVGVVIHTCWGKSASMIQMQLKDQLIRSSSKEPYGEAKMYSIRLHEEMWGSSVDYWFDSFIYSLLFLCTSSIFLS